MKKYNPFIKISNLYKYYHINETFLNIRKKKNKKKIILENINYEFKTNNIYGLIGANGAGKTSLLKIISGINLPTKGEIKFNGKIVSIYNEDLAFNVNYSFQENIEFLLRIYDQYTFENYKNLTNKIKEFFQNDYEEISTSKNFKNINKFLLKKIELIAVLNIYSDIILLDEIFNDFDLRFKKKIIEYLKGIKKNKIIIFVSHDIYLIDELADNVLFIYKKNIINENGNKFDTLKLFFKNADLENLFIEKKSPLTQNHNSKANFLLSDGENKINNIFKSSNEISLYLVNENVKKFKELNYDLNIEFITNNKFEHRLNPIFCHSGNINFENTNLNNKRTMITRLKKNIFHQREYKLHIKMMSDKNSIILEDEIKFKIYHEDRKDLNDYTSASLLLPIIDW